MGVVTANISLLLPDMPGSIAKRSRELRNLVSTLKICSVEIYLALETSMCFILIENYCWIKNIIFFRLMEKCLEVILSGAAYSKKGEELLWKRAVYDVVQRCKQSRQVSEYPCPFH